MKAHQDQIKLHHHQAKADYRPIPENLPITAQLIEFEGAVYNRQLLLQDIQRGHYLDMSQLS